MSAPAESDLTTTIAGKRIALVGRLGGMNRREARNLVASYGGSVVNLESQTADWVVIGAEEPPLAETDLLSPLTLQAAARGELQIIGETELWQTLGLVDPDQLVSQVYTPAMLADLLGVSVRVVRRWHRLGLITPVQTLHRLPYFDFQEVATARRLAHWIASGASAKAIEQRLVDLVQILPNIQRPLDQLSILVEGKEILLRQGEGLLELGGQLRFDFDAAEDHAANDSRFDDHATSPHDTALRAATLAAPTEIIDDRMPQILSFSDAQRRSVEGNVNSQSSDADELFQAVYEAEDADDLDTAVDCCHAILARDGPRGDVCFLLAELLYRNGQIIAARERYYAAIEMDPEFAEARTSLGNVLAETGQLDLAVAAYRGAIALYPEYVEAHFGLAKLLDQMGQFDEAARAWTQIIDFSPKSPWAQQARKRLQLET